MFSWCCLICYDVKISPKGIFFEEVNFSLFTQQFSLFFVAFSSRWSVSELLLAKMSSSSPDTSSSGLGARLKPYLEQLDKELHKRNKVTEVLQQAEHMTGIKRLNIVLAALGLLVFIFIFTFGSDLLIEVVAFLYPAYRSHPLSITYLLKSTSVLSQYPEFKNSANLARS